MPDTIGRRQTTSRVVDLAVAAIRSRREKLIEDADLLRLAGLVAEGNV